MVVGLRERAKSVNPEALVAQRIKRRASIELKLRRFSGMNLSRMQDLGGARAVVGSVAEVDELVARYRGSSVKHKLVSTYDYIREPKDSGYRGVHLVYNYYSDRNDTYNGLKIELQLRSPLQHVWATAVETVGTFTHQALKSSQGEDEWLRFFALMGSAIARREECATVPGTPSGRELIKELRDYAKKLDVDKRLKVYGAALQLHEDHLVGGHYYLLELHTGSTEPTISVRGYPKKELEQAERDYAEREVAIRDTAGYDAVLVSVESLDALRRAYPNYFLDTDAFRQAVKRAIS